jgi:hypothetical protein
VAKHKGGKGLEAHMKRHRKGHKKTHRKGAKRHKKG